MAKKKPKSRHFKKLKHSPTLNTVLMVEDALKNMDESLITVAGLKKILPKQVNHNTLMNILDYLQKSNKIYMSVKGITWLVNDNPKFREAIRKAHDYDDIIADLKRRNLLTS
ncbi:hypothetical protein KY348_01260 [Candidatus Woesearchaeota archaeon]|nr:hypothetical protein [Candidatus Woesearchaeota archaeon]